MTLSEPTIGDNMPPATYNVIVERLNETRAYMNLRDKAAELLAAVDRVPESIEDEQTAGKLSDFISKQIRPAIKVATAYRVKEKQPYLEAGRTVDAVFKNISEPLERAVTLLNTRLTLWDRKVEAIARQAATEAARVAAAEAEQARVEAARQAAAMETEGQLQAAMDVAEAAAQARADAVEATRRAEAPAAELSRVRTPAGTTRSLMTWWDYEILDYDQIPLEGLRPHIPRDAIEQAIRSYIKAGGRELFVWEADESGPHETVRIFKNSRTRSV